MGRFSDKGMGAEFLTLRVFFAIKLLRHQTFSPSSIQTTMHYVPGCVNPPPNRTPDGLVCRTDREEVYFRIVFVFSHLA